MALQESIATTQIDLDFADFRMPPFATYEDTLRWGNNWRGDAGQQMELLRLSVAAEYEEYGGGSDQAPLILEPAKVVQEAIKGRVDHSAWCSSFAPEIADVALRYLQGEGDDYHRMSELLNFVKGN